MIIAMAVRETTVRARVPASLKTEAEEVFDALGITSSDAIRLFLNQVRLRRGLPFPVSLPRDRENDDLLLSPRQRQAAIDSIYED
jgi:DNA-damage-inducible protein J